MIEGVADAVRYLNGGLPWKIVPKAAIIWMVTARQASSSHGFTQTKSPDFLRKFNRSTLEVIPWSFDGGVKYALGNVTT